MISSIKSLSFSWVKMTEAWQWVFARAPSRPLWRLKRFYDIKFVSNKAYRVEPGGVILSGPLLIIYHNLSVFFLLYRLVICQHVAVQTDDMLVFIQGLHPPLA